MTPRYVVEEWGPGPASAGWKRIGGELTGRQSAIDGMQRLAATDPEAYGPHGYLRLRVRETTGGAR